MAVSVEGLVPSQGLHRIRRPVAAASVFMMADAPSAQKKGKLQTITKKRADQEIEVKPKEDLDKESYWRLLLHNDDVRFL